MNILTFESFESRKLPIIFVAGLDNRPGDLSLEEQVDSVKKYLLDFTITAFCNASECKRHNHVSKESAKNFIKRNPNSIILLFSSGTGLSKTASEFITDPKNLFILEPYRGAKNGILSAIKNGVPLSNVILGRSKGSGLGLIDGASSTPTGYTHFGSLKYASLVISRKYK